jgi:hypothetical protein
MSDTQAQAEAQEKPKIYPGDWDCVACGCDDAIADGFCLACWLAYIGIHKVEAKQ